MIRLCVYCIAVVFLCMKPNVSLSNNPEYCYLYSTYNFLNSCFLKSYVLLFYQNNYLLIVFRQSDGLCKKRSAFHRSNLSNHYLLNYLYYVSNLASPRYVFYILLCAEFIQVSSLFSQSLLLTHLMY